MSIYAALAATAQAKKSGVLSSNPVCPRCFAVTGLLQIERGGDVRQLAQRLHAAGIYS